MSGIYIVHCNNFQHLSALLEKAHQQKQLQLVYFIIDYREREVPGEGKAISLLVILAFFYTESINFSWASVKDFKENALFSLRKLIFECNF